MNCRALVLAAATLTLFTGAPPVIARPQGAVGSASAKTADRASRPASTKGVAQTTAQKRAAALKARMQAATANFAPVGDGLTFADPFYGGTTDGVIITSITPLEAQAPLLRRLADCTLEAGIGSSGTFQVSQRIEKYEDRLHQAALLTTPVDKFPNGCTDPVTGVPSQPGVVYGTDSGGNFYAAVAEPDLTTFEYTNQLTLVHTQGNPVSSQPSIMSTVTLDPNSSVTVEGDLVVGDLNGDSKLDIVVPLIDLSNGSGGTSANNSLAILLNQGNGAVGTPTYLPLNVFPVSVTLADLNKDGKLDIIVIGTPATTGGQQGMEIFLGKGDGTFQSPIEGPTGFPSVDPNSSQLPLNSAVHVLTGDFNGDGKQDIVASTGDILLGNGDGTFTVAPTTLGIPGKTGAGITSADFNHDGKPDLAVAVYPANIYIFFGNGDGSFKPGNVYSAPYDSTDLTASEIDGDGNYDIVVGVCSGGLYLPDGLETLSGYFLLGRSDGTFAGPVSYQPSAADLANLDSQTFQDGIFVGDVTGDGKPDLVSFEYDPSGGSVAVTRPYKGMSDGDLVYGAQINSAATISDPITGTVNLVDVDGDGKLDLAYLTASAQDGSYVSITTLHGKGDGTFGSESDSPVPSAYPEPGGTVFSSMVIGNFNADTKPDAVFFVLNNGNTGSTLEFAAGNGDGTFGTPAVIDSTLVTATGIAEVDLNGDGKMDVVVTDAGPSSSGYYFLTPVVKVYLGKGDGTFAAPLVLTFDVNQYGLEQGEMALAVADLRGNGKLDIIAGALEPSEAPSNEASLDQGIYQVYLGNGDGTFQKQTAVTSAVGFDGPMLAVDVNRDGKPDLMISLYSEMIYLTGNGDGTFGAPSLIQLPGMPAEFALADLNGDGFPDLATIGAGISPALNVPAVPLLGNTKDTTTALTASSTEATPGTSIKLTATVMPSSGTAVPTGSVNFFDGSTQIGSGTLDGTGVATYSTTSLALGSHSIVATYNGDANFTISTSDTLTITIADNPITVTFAPTSLTFSSQALNSSSTAQSITLSNPGSAAVSITSVTIAGTNAGDFSQTNTCGTSVAANSNCTISVVFKPTSSGSRSASVSIADAASGSPQSVGLTGTGAAAGVPTAALAPTSLTFASQGVNTTSAAQTITLSNSSATALTVSSIAVTGTNAGDFSETNSCGGSVAASGNCTITVTFKPTASGARTASVSIADNASPATQTAMLTGTGAAAGTPTAALAPTSLTFASQSLNTTSASQTIKLSNSSATALTVSNIAVTGTNAGDFAETNNCGGSVAASGNCTITVTFKPTASGARAASITVTDNASPATQTATLAGTGAAAGTPTAALSPTGLTFASQSLNTASASQTITLSNSSATALTVSSIAVTGTNVGDFAETNTCGGSVAASGNCTITVTFKPTASGARAAAITVTDNASPATQTATLAGTGAAAGTPKAAVSPTSLTFATQLVTSSSAAQMIKLSNSGDAALTISGITFTGTNASDFTETDNCGTSVAAAANCTINVAFKPAATGARTATISVADNAPGSPQTAALTGAGIDFNGSATPSGSTTATVVAGSSATYALEVAATGGVATDSLSVAVTCASSTATVGCSTSSTAVTVTPAAPGMFTITATTQGQNAAARKQSGAIPPSSTPRAPLTGYAICGVLLAFIWRFRNASGAFGRTLRTAGPLAVAVLTAAIFAAGCSGGNGSSGSGGTPAGTYNLTVTLTDGSVSHTLPLTLTVTSNN